MEGSKDTPLIFKIKRLIRIATLSLASPHMTVHQIRPSNFNQKKNCQPISGVLELNIKLNCAEIGNYMVTANSAQA